MEVFPNWTAIPIVFFILTLTFLLNRMFFRPLGKTLEERHSKIEGARLEAEQIRQTSQQRLVEFDKRMRDARRESDQRMAEIRAAALAERNRLVSSKRAETDRMLSASRQELRAKTEEARKTLETQSREFAYRIATQILKRPVRSQQKGSIAR